MKRIFYIALMMVFSFLLTFFVYYSVLFCLIFYRIVPMELIISLTDAARSPVAYAIVTGVALLWGYHFGVKCWKIIYIDKVYRFR